MDYIDWQLFKVSSECPWEPLTYKYPFAQSDLNFSEVSSVSVIRQNHVMLWPDASIASVGGVSVVEWMWAFELQGLKCKFTYYMWNLCNLHLREEGMTTHSSILAQRIPMDREAWRATVHGVRESGMTEQLSTAVTLKNLDSYVKWELKDTPK